MTTSTILQPDSRGRFALGSHLTSSAEGYKVHADEYGTITLTPIVSTMTAEQHADFLADPVGYAAMLKAAEEVGAGNLETVGVEEFLDGV
ncbi:MAG: hypothetical protein DRJ50_07825 [Actinobacteria bacterium]|nr:MAG: hypothetical protein DRJ50_07825 [Actinomycetota bacterium]